MHRIILTILKRIRGSKFKHNDSVPYYGGKKKITKVLFSYTAPPGWYYQLADEHGSFSEGIVEFYFTSVGQHGISWYKNFTYSRKQKDKQCK